MTADEFRRQFDISGDLPSVAAPGEDQHDGAEARRFAARRYLSGVGFEGTYDTLVHDVVKLLPESQRPEAFRYMAKVMPREKFDEFMLGILVKYFSRRQLDALAEFQRTPAGQSIAARGWRTTGPYVPSEGPLDTPEDRRVAVQRYAFEINTKRLYGDTMHALARRISSLEESEAFLWQASRGYREFEQTLLTSMERYYTRSEIEASARFHRSPEGRATMTQFPAMMSEVAEYFANIMRSAKR